MDVVILDSRYSGFSASILNTILDDNGNVIFILALRDGTIIKEPMNKVKLNKDYVAINTRLSNIEQLLRSILVK